MMPGALRPHRRQHGADAEEDALEVDVGGMRPGARVGGGERPDRLDDAGVVDSASIRPKASCARATAACTWLHSATSQVIASAWAPARRSRVASCGDPLGRAGEQQQRRALRGHRLGGGGADAAAGAGEDHGLAGELAHARLPREAVFFRDERRSGAERQGRSGGHGCLGRAKAPR